MCPSQSPHCWVYWGSSRESYFLLVKRMESELFKSGPWWKHHMIILLWENVLIHQRNVFLHIVGCRALLLKLSTSLTFISKIIICTFFFYFFLNTDAMLSKHSFPDTLDILILCLRLTPSPHANCCSNPLLNLPNFLNPNLNDMNLSFFVPLPHPKNCRYLQFLFCGFSLKVSCNGLQASFWVHFKIPLRRSLRSHGRILILGKCLEMVPFISSSVK